ncbi:hypothetical protein CW745_12750 [Psychromonas sp. psych-6C06]|uniref:GFA family protein n=1 Tax=Psychromonas sp. psych-6C06 TaxID=2058089 RepID=UPI000C32223D|nr:GFA family protein [Psychromonas sp. psych-6C06]PKF60739.1 hypothetical protein CW745_12750 [Psychromonas sp. psych-6C06]
MEKANGKCHCGAVTWVATLPVTTVIQCHCQNCRKLQGSDYSSWVVVAEENFKVKSGIACISHYHFNDRSQKSFCRHCGSVVYGVNGKHFPSHKLFSLGNIIDYCEQLKPQLSVYKEYAVPWCKS